MGRKGWFVVAGFIFWCQADWWAYVDMTQVGRGMVPMFKLHPAK